jgi:hypothetical protein
MSVIAQWEVEVKEEEKESEKIKIVLQRYSVEK